MTLKSIGVFVDATPEGEKRIDYAAALAGDMEDRNARCRRA
jgi:hypothetical protein